MLGGKNKDLHSHYNHESLLLSDIDFIVSCFSFQNLNVWLGGLFIPEAYITATRQFVAQANNWSLEELYLDVSGIKIMWAALVLHFLVRLPLTVGQRVWNCLFVRGLIISPQPTLLQNPV